LSTRIENNNVTTSNVTAPILAGGKASRFNGQDKGLIEFHGKPMIKHIIDTLRPQVDKILISANRNISEYEKFGYPVIQDTINDLDHLQGPLAGILQGLEQSTTPWVLLSPCDTPFIPDDYCQKMIQEVSIDSEIIVVTVCENKLQPLFALVPTGFQKQLTQALENKIFKVGQWLTSMPHVKLEFSEKNMFTNINNADELARASRIKVK